MNKRLFLLSLLFISNFSNAISIDGYKDIKFGMSMAQIEALGFKCNQVEFRCSAINFGSGNNYVKNGATIFDKKVINIAVKFNSNDQVFDINVGVGIGDSSDIRESITATFGTPKEIKNSDMDKNKGFESAFFRSSWLIGEVEVHAITLLGKSISTSAVNFVSQSLSPKTSSTKPSKDF